MKFILILLTLCMVLAITSKAQNAYYDASKINEEFKNGSVEKALKIMLPYFMDEKGKIAYQRFFTTADSGYVRKAKEYLYNIKIEKVCQTITSFRLDLGNPLLSTCESYRTAHDDLSNDSTKYLQLVKIISDSSKRIQVVRIKLIIDTIVDTHSSAFVDLSKVYTQLTDSIKSDSTQLTAVKERIDSNVALIGKYQDSVITILKRNLRENREILDRIYGPNFNPANISTPNDITIYRAEKEKQDDLHEQAVQTTETAALTNFKMPTQSELIDALAIYIARRFKQEVAITLVAELKKALNKKPYISELFPETIKLFNNMEDFELPKFGAMWNHAISEDFIKLPYNIKNSKTIKDKMTNSQFKDKFDLFSDVVTISELALQKNTLIEITSLYKADPTIFSSVIGKQALEMLDIINSELYRNNKMVDNISSGGYWLSWKDLQQMKPNDYTTFLTLIEGKYSVFFDAFNIKKPSKWIDGLSGRKALFKNYLVKSLIILNNFQSSQSQYLERLKANADAKYTGVDFWEVQKNLFEIIMNDSILNLPPKAKSIISLFQKGTVIYKLLEKKNYAAMVHETVSVLEEVLPAQTTRLNEIMVKTWKTERSKFENIAPKFNTSFASFLPELENEISRLRTEYNRCANGELKKVFLNNLKPNSSKTYAKLLVESDEAFKPLLKIKDTESLAIMMKNIITSVDTTTLSIPITSKSRFLYITRSAEFFTDIMSANNSKKLANVIEAYAMPANSYKIKRSSRYSIDLNAYVGAYGGVEFSKKNDTTKGAGVYGLSVPVGITFSWGSRGKSMRSSSTSYVNKNGNIKDLSGNSFSVGITLIDIAAVVSYRIGAGEDAALPKEVKWSQILSPGISARWGIRNTPLAISLGAQLTPQLRSFKDEGVQQAWRLYGGLFFDLPLFNVYRR